MSFTDQYPPLGDLASKVPMAQQPPPDQNAPGGPPPDPKTMPVPGQTNTVQPAPPPQPGQDQPPQQGQEEPPYFGGGPPGEDDDGGGWGNETPEEYRANYMRIAAQGPIGMLHPDMYERMYRARQTRDQHHYITGPGYWRTQREQPAQYVPAAKREFGEWGRPWWPIEAGMSLANIVGSPFMPSPYEAYNVIREGGRQLGIYASPGVGQPAARASNFATMFAPILDALSKGAFSKNFNAARMGSLRMQREQMLLDAKISQQRHQEELMRFGRIFELAKIGAISSDDARQQVRDLAMQTGHQFLIGVLNTKDLGGVEEYLNWEDQKMRDMWAATTSLSKATGGGEGDAELMRQLGREPGSGGAGTSKLPTKQGYSQDQKVAQADTGTVTDATTNEDFSDDLQKKLGMTPQELEVARAVAGHEDNSIYDNLKKAKTPDASKARARIDNAADAIRKRAGNILHDDKLSPEQKVEQLSHVTPNDADRLGGLLDYSLDPDKIPAAKGERERMVTMAKAANKNWKQGTYKIVQKYHDANTKEGVIIQRVSSLDGAMFSLNQAMLKLSETDKVTTNMIKSWIDGKFIGDPKFFELYTAIRDIAQDTMAIQSGTGRPAVTSVNQMVQHMLVSSSPAQIRSQVMIDMRAAYGNVKTLRDQYREEVGDPHAKLPFFGRDVDDKFNAYLRQNPYTGEMPEDAPASLRGVGKTPKTLPGWITKTTADHPGQELKPLTKNQIRAGWDKLDELNQRTDPESRRQAQWLRERLGMFADRGSLD